VSAPVIGVIGANGAVGAALAQQLLSSGTWQLRLGSRTRLGYKPVTHQAETRHVEVMDAASLREFCAGCRVVVNCTGPSFQLLDTVARSAFAAGADYVDPGGDEPLHRRLADLPLASSGRTALLTAGMMPGISALLIRRLAGDPLFRPHNLIAYVGGRGRISAGSAIDYILSLGHDEQASLAIWRDGVRVPRAMRPQTDLDVPFFAPGATAYPYIGQELTRVARALRLPQITWLNVFEGTHMIAALARLQGAMSGVSDVDAAALDLARAADLDLFGLAPYQLFYLRLDGEVGGAPLSRTVLLRGTSAQELTASMAALTTESLLRGEIPPGLHFAGEVLSPDLIERLKSMRNVTACSEHTTTPETVALAEEGAL
jgi:hypothetical protein